MPKRVVVGALLTLAFAPSLGLGQRTAQAALLDPIGTWRCVLYGDPAHDGERALMRFAPDGSTRMARSSTQDSPAWLRISDWQTLDGELTFSDSRSGRRFKADLAHTTLKGEWRSHDLLGGWWCSQAGSDSGSGIDILSRADTPDTRRLIPEVMATPTFPIQAVREAREGRVVLCFVVEPTGEIYQPEFMELSDEIFRATSLDALMRSRYKPWDAQRDGGARPACRSFVYKLDYVR